MSKKAPSGPPPSPSLLQATLAEIDREYGVGVARAGQDMVDEPTELLSAGPSLDAALGGGIQEGSWVSVSGAEKCGKTSLLLSICAMAQRHPSGPKPILYLGVEHRLRRRDLLGIEGLKIDSASFTLIQSVKGRLLSSVDFLSIAQKYLAAMPSCVVVIDSVSSLVSPKKLGLSPGSSDHGAGNQVLAQFCSTAAASVRVNKSVVLGAVQYYANTTGFGYKNIEKSAAAWRYQTDVWLQCTGVKPWVEEGIRVGQEVNWLVRASEEGPPGGAAEGKLRYGMGTDEIAEALELAIITGLASSSGGRITLNAVEKKPVFRGKDKAINAIRENPQWRESLGLSP